MQCTHPILLSNLDKKKFPEGLLVACGRCLPCRKQRAREWALRLIHEKPYSLYQNFVTLTYDEKHCPKCYSVIKREAVRYIKKLRKVTGSKIKYYMCGEYGGKNGRPHYHLLVYVYDNKYDDIYWSGKMVMSKNKEFSHWEKEPIYSLLWGKGSVMVGNVTEGSIYYVVEYIDKKIYNSMGVELGKRREPFRLMSTGIGEKYVIENQDKIREDLCFEIQGRKIGLPRYYKKKLSIDPKVFQKLSGSQEFEKLKKHMKKNKIKKMNVNHWKALYELKKAQRAKNSEARIRLYHKDRLL